ncbi:hypothetical protein [Kitasatospora sp. HPMI-4]|uniref:hypothetical protein n=1 Tax=Kitasatospora sp. HPMI-4 TaxID=3448443 RepID=UPI003F1D8DA0
MTGSDREGALPAPYGGRSLSSHATASEHGRVYQSAGTQQITEHHYHYSVELQGQLACAIAQRQSADQTMAGTEKVVLFLLDMVASLEVRCVNLEERESKARAAGRAEALAEIQQELRDSEERLVHAQDRLARARREREAAENLRADALRRAEEYRLAYEELKRQQDPSDRRDRLTDWRTADLMELSEYDRALEAVDAELAAYRQEINRLSEQAGRRFPTSDPEVVPGEVVGRTAEDQHRIELRGRIREVLDSSPYVVRSELPAQPGGTAPPAPRSGMVGWLIAWLVRIVLLLLPPLTLMVVGAGIRTMYSSDPGPTVLAGVLFTVFGVGGCVVLEAVLLFVNYVSLVEPTDAAKNDRRLKAFRRCRPFYLLTSVALFVVSTACSPAVLGCVGVWGHALVHALGLVH